MKTLLLNLRNTPSIQDLYFFNFNFSAFKSFNDFTFIVFPLLKFRSSKPTTKYSYSYILNRIKKTFLEYDPDLLCFSFLYVSFSNKINICLIYNKYIPSPIVSSVTNYLFGFKYPFSKLYHSINDVKFHIENLINPEF